MAWDDNADDYPGYRLSFVPHGDSTSPTPGWSFSMFIRFQGEPLAIPGSREQIVRDLIDGMNDRGYKLRQEELSARFEHNGTDEVMTTTEDLFVPTIDYFPGWD